MNATDNKNDIVCNLELTYDERTLILLALDQLKMEIAAKEVSARSQNLECLREHWQAEIDTIADIINRMYFN